MYDLQHASKLISCFVNKLTRWQRYHDRSKMILCEYPRTAGIYEKKKNILRDIPHRGLDSVPNYSDKPTQHSLLLTFSLFRRALTGEFFY